MFAAAAMSLSSVCVVTNALRLKLFQADVYKKRARAKKSSESGITELTHTQGGHTAGIVSDDRSGANAQGDVTFGTNPSSITEGQNALDAEDENIRRWQTGVPFAKEEEGDEITPDPNKILQKHEQTDLGDVPQNGESAHGGDDNKGEDKMEKIIKIDGMWCKRLHCSSRVEKALNAIEGVSAKVNLEEAYAKISLSADVSNQTLKDAVADAGYEVVSIH